jgi:hypothetical protein
MLLPDSHNIVTINTVDGQRYWYEHDEFKEAIIVREKPCDNNTSVYSVSFETMQLAFNKKEDYFLDSYINGIWDKEHLKLFVKFFKPEIYQKYKLLFT